MSSPSNKAAKEAQANTEAQQRMAQDAQNKINALFDNPARTAEYQQLGKDTTAYYMGDLNQQKTKNDLQMKFAQARGGLIGSSVQTDQAQTAGQDYLKGVIQAQRLGNSAAAGLQSQDETSRANLIAQAQGGLNATSAATNAASAMRANLAGAQSANQANALGDTFGDFASIYQRSQDAAALRAGQKYSYNTVYQPGFGAGGGSGRFGG